MFKTWLQDLRRDQCGATAIEYGLLVAMIGLACVTAMSKLGATQNSGFGFVLNQVGNVMN